VQGAAGLRTSATSTKTSLCCVALRARRTAALRRSKEHATGVAKIEVRQPTTVATKYACARVAYAYFDPAKHKPMGHWVCRGWFVNRKGRTGLAD
jgi:hypothetical protein